MKKTSNEKISLITTERNEVDDIATFIDSALSQSLKPDEIIIADGGSTDGTLGIIEKYIKDGAPIKLVHAPGNRSIGRNAATKAAMGPIVAVTDVGSRLDDDWLKYITQPFRDNKKAMAVSGGFEAEPKTFFEKVSATLMLSPNDNIDIETWLPSSRSIAYKKEAWEKVGGYPEHTNFNEDTPFDLALKKAGYKFEDGLKAMVYWRPRPNLKEFYRQYYYYALGDGIDSLDISHFIKLTLKYAICLMLTIVALFTVPVLALLPVTYIWYRFSARIYRPWRKIKGLQSLLLMYVLLICFDVSQLLGYWNGYLRRKSLAGSERLVR